MEKYHQLTFQLRKKAIPNMRTRNTTPTTPCGLNLSLCCMSRSPFNKILTSEWQAIPSLFIEGGSVKRWTRKRLRGCEREGRWHDLRFRYKRVWERIGDERRSLRWK